MPPSHLPWCAALNWTGFSKWRLCPQMSSWGIGVMKLKYLLLRRPSMFQVSVILQRTGYLFDTQKLGNWHYATMNKLTFLHVYFGGNCVGCQKMLCGTKNADLGLDLCYFLRRFNWQMAWLPKCWERCGEQVNITIEFNVDNAIFKMGVIILASQSVLAVFFCKILHAN